MKFRKWLMIAAFAVASALSFTLAACTDQGSGTGNGDPNHGGSSVVEGPESGVYYFGAGSDEYLVTLSGGNRFTLHMLGTDKSGTYEMEGNTITFDFLQDADGTASATLDGNVLTLSYQEGEWRFLKKVNYTVSFEEAGGTEIADVTVVNGRTFARPADPEREGYRLIGWCTSAELDEFYSFETDTVTSDLTLYAYWAAYVPGQSEYTVSFDLGGADAAMADQETVGGRLYAVGTPEREGYVFGGWWISMYEDAAKLSYEWTSDTVFTEDTTLYAVWTAEDAAAGLGLTVNADGVAWGRLPESGSLTIEGPDGFTRVERTVGVSGSASYPLDFASVPAGDYVITLTAGDAQEQLYYKNKSLSRVSGFAVQSPSMLVFEGVEHAQRYYITVECGDASHNHTLFDLGTATSFNFVNCPMPEGGIRFTVTATADGYASSTSHTYVYNRLLGAVTGVTVNEETQTLVWNSVAGAAEYVVTVNGDTVYRGGATSYSLKNYAAGTLEIAVRAVTAGYNSAAATQLSYEKTGLAAPSNVRVLTDSVTWDEVDGATSYEIRIGDQTFSNIAGTQFAFESAVGITWTESADYTISVRAVGAAASLWSDPVDARYLALYQTLTYEHNTLSWRPVIGAQSYAVQVNGGVVQLIDAGTTSVHVTLTQDGQNTLTFTTARRKANG